jgi:hypothetical protein
MYKDMVVRRGFCAVDELRVSAPPCENSVVLVILSGGLDREIGGPQIPEPLSREPLMNAYFKISEPIRSVEFILSAISANQLK